jgi:hypothetical protein
MPVLMQICAVAVTLAIVGIAIATIRAMRRFEVTSHEFSRTAEKVRETVAQAEMVTRQLQDIAVSVQSTLTPVRNAAHRLAAVADRVTEVSNVIVDQVETPVRNTLAVLTGLRTGTRSLLGSLARRVGIRHSNGGYPHE